MTTPTWLTEIETRCEKATHGEWRWTCFRPEISLISMDARKPCVLAVLDGQLATSKNGILELLSPMNPDAQFIAHSRTDIPALIATIRELAKALEKIRNDRIAYWPEECQHARAILARLEQGPLGGDEK